MARITLAQAVAATFPVAVLLLSGAPLAWAHDPTSVACQNAERTPSVAEPNLALEKDPGSLEIRFQLASALIDQRCYDAAVHVLEAGQALHPRNGALQAKLRHARSLISEQQYFDGLEQAEAAARISRNLLRCTKLGDLNACDDALALKPDDPQITFAKADALMQTRRPVDALALYRRAGELGALRTVVEAKVAEAESQRQAFASTCQNESGAPAIQACRAALARGAPDEFALHERIAILLQADNQPAPALDAYMAAHSLHQDDRSVALAIVALSESTGRDDAVTLAARGSALVTLGRPRDAVPVLRQAQALAPGLREIKTRLATAERLARTELRVVSPVPAPGTVARANTSTAATVVATSARTYSNVAKPTRSH